MSCAKRSVARVLYSAARVLLMSLGYECYSVAKVLLGCCYSVARAS